MLGRDQLSKPEAGFPGQESQRGRKSWRGVGAADPAPPGWRLFSRGSDSGDRAPPSCFPDSEVRLCRLDHDKLPEDRRHATAEAPKVPPKPGAAQRGHQPDRSPARRQGTGGGSQRSDSSVCASFPPHLNTRC